VLLIAGYGVAVGVGALVGLVLGFLAGALGVMWLGRGPGRSVSFANLDWSSEDQSSDRPTADLIAEMHELTEVMTIDLGSVKSVTPVLMTVEAGGLSVELVSIEQREAGLTMLVDVRTHLGTVAPASMARVSVGDDVGTRYRASAQGHGGQAGAMRYVVSVVAAFPPSATRLDISIDHFIDPFPGRGRGIVGPWAFSAVMAPG
jgi:hypothetical protein